MDVTRHNFLELLPQIEQDITSCDFISIDTEFSGLRRGNGGQFFDDHQERYEKLRNSCMGYSIIQFGLTCFRRLKDSYHYSSNGYNLYVFPYRIQRIPKQPERNFDFQVSAVTFLRSHNFDFNFLFDNGLCYLTCEEENQVKNTLLNYEDREMSRSLTIVPEEHEEFVNEVIKKVDSFLEDASSSQLELEPCNSFMRKLVYEALSGSKYRNRLDVSTKNVSPSSRDSFLLISKSSVETKEKTLRDLVTEASGVSRILQFISQSKKPIVGHNVFLDIIHIVGQFMTSNLPDSYQEYKELVHSLFPEIYDTKFISSTAAFKNLITSSTLEDLIKQLSQDPFNTVVFTSERSVPEPGNRYHEAGYDADVTGQCFIFMNNYLQEKFDVKFREESSAIGPEIKRFVNRIHLTFSFDLDHYHFGGPEVNLPRDQVFYISFTEETTQQRLNELMSPFGYFQYQWLGDSSMLVGFKDHAKASFFRKAFKADLDVSAVKSYADFKKISREESDKRNSHASYKRRIQSLTPGLKRVRVDGTSSSTPANPEEETPTTNLSSRNMTTYFEEVADW